METPRAISIPTDSKQKYHTSECKGEYYVALVQSRTTRTTPIAGPRSWPDRRFKQWPQRATPLKAFASYPRPRGTRTCHSEVVLLMQKTRQCLWALETRGKARSGSRNQRSLLPMNRRSYCQRTSRGPPTTVFNEAPKFRPHCASLQGLCASHLCSPRFWLLGIRPPPDGT
jgi:hypothetical protein